MTSHRKDEIQPWKERKKLIGFSTVVSNKVTAPPRQPPLSNISFILLATVWSSHPYGTEASHAHAFRVCLICMKLGVLYVVTVS